jgi:hypothetical protein
MEALRMNGLGNTQSPVNQGYVWVAEYFDGTHLSEFNFETREENSFHAIKPDQLLRFGLVGCGMNLYYEVFGGVFKLAGQMIELVYKTDKKEYHLTGQQKMYNDIITYKDAQMFISLDGRTHTGPTITQYSFGYKEQLSIDDVEFKLKALCKVPIGGLVYLTIRLVANKALKGKLLIKKNGRIVEEIEAPLKPGVGGETNWEVK